MKRIALISVALTALVLSACGVNNDNSNDTAVQSSDITKPTKVNNSDNNFTYGSRANDNTNNDTQRKNHIEDKIVSMNEVEQANVTIKNNNVYIAAQLNNNNNHLSADVAQRIADQAKSIDHNIENVYISVNPDVSINPDRSDRMNDSSNDIQLTSN
ncbi:YhcN/YlaJ family sporulation lipoprotein [Niallia sp. XMNu-256]|uniref:YhcN/YlaJ family sporulation lipoprotein n=1 Tax=Niallia sp. XMNu-256 TaxID=3082444 RepID=UPI0030CCB28E